MVREYSKALDEQRRSSALTESWEQTRNRLRGSYGWLGDERSFTEESLVKPVRTTENLLRDALAPTRKRMFRHVIDFDDSWVVYEEVQYKADDSPSERTTYRVSYEISESGRVTLGDDPEIVRRETVYLPAEQSKAFVTEVNDKTILTARAGAALKTTSLNPHYLDIRGRFVGADQANRNKAFWSTGDLEFGEASVKNGPLNWLHEGRHIIGTLTDSTLVQAREQSKDLFDKRLHPYIATSAVVWKWLWPNESEVIEQAAAKSKLALSMECYSETVICSGPNGCGEEYPYAQAQQAANGVCDHLKARSSVRRFKNPTFLGGAVIVPPVRPGWKDAHAELMEQGQRYAEAAYEQAGQPDVADGEWDVLMAQVLAFAQE